MKKLIILAILFSLFILRAQSQDTNVPANWPDSIYTGKQSRMHVQGVAVDQVNGHVYFSFTDRLIKMDLSGKLLGSVTGFLGHLGDLEFNPADGKVYGSLEYKNDAIGKGIRNTLGVEHSDESGFYIAIFDVAQIGRPDMDANTEDVFSTVYLSEVVKDYEAQVQVGDKMRPHRFACSGIDGVTFAPAMGSANRRKMYLYVAYGVYGETDRDDNDHQVILKYDVANWDKYAKRLSQGNLHHSGPTKPMEKYFVKTGNTTYGIQNLAYDPHSGNLFAAVYRGKKAQFPNYDLFVIDGHAKPSKSRISSNREAIKVKALSLLQAGPKDPDTGIRGWHFKWGATGLCPLGNGLFYISHPLKSPDGQQQSTIYLYEWIGDNEGAFTRIK